MKNRLYFPLLAGLFLFGSLIFGLYTYREITKTRVTAVERTELEKSDEIILAGDYSFPPLSFTDIEGQYSGYEADLVASLEVTLGIPLTYHQVLWSEAVESLDTGEITAITGMRVTSERSEKYHFTDPYWETAYSMVFKDGSEYEDLLNKDFLKIAVQNRSATYDYFVDHYYREDIKFFLIDQPAEAILMLEDNLIDIWFENYQVARYELLRAGMLDEVDFYIIPESVGRYSLAFGSGYEHLVPIFNKALLSLEKDGILTELDRKWFGLSDLRTSSPWPLALPTIFYVIFTLFILVLFWNRLLQRKVSSKTEQLSRSEMKFKASFEGTHDAIYIIDELNKIVECNGNACALFGYEREELIGATPYILYPERQGDDSDSFQLLKEVIGSVISSGNMIKVEMLQRRKDGSTFLSEAALRSYFLGEERVVQANITDITEHKTILSQLEFLSLHDQLTGLYNRNFFEMELNRLRETNAYPITLISCDIDGLKLINDSMGHDVGDRLLKACSGLLAKSLRSTDKLARVGGDEFCIIMPETDNIGAEEIARRIRSNIVHYNEKHPDLPLGLSLGLATATNREMLFKDLFKQADDHMYRDKLHRSSSIKNRVVQSLLAALAERDNLTGGHAERLEEHCLAIGEKITLNSRQLADLALLAKVHDLGKVGIPDKILNKKGPLSKDEWNVMKEHSEKGFRIALSSPDLSGIADLILKHHEHWDGNGYPLGLKGEEIPIECRVLAIVDAYDAMTNKRPYAPVKSPGEALEEIARGAGSQFDPRIVEVFFSLLEKV
jgi:diguanylate cyclase (GGDEF)-like protein/PAS domain S-box-containing protein